MAMTSTMMRPIAPAPSTSASPSPSLSSKPSAASPSMTTGTVHSSAAKTGHKTRTLVPLRPSPASAAASKLPRTLVALAPSPAKAQQQRSTTGQRPLLAARPSKGPSATTAGATTSAAGARATTSSAATMAAALHPRLAPAGADPKRRLQPGPAAIKSSAPGVQANRRDESQKSSEPPQADLAAIPKRSTVPSVLSAAQSPSPIEASAARSLTPSDRAASATPTVKQETDDGSASSSLSLASPIAVQPKKEWVLPARAKPGRKPSEVEPPTKRKAQNRASQRAFRQRRQSYLATLEEKVQAYEQRGAEQTSEIQRVAQRIKQENEQLKQTVTKLQARIVQLEGELKQQQEQRLPSPPSRAPLDADELGASQLKRTSWDWSANSADGSGGPVPTYKHAYAPRLEPPAVDASTTIERDCGFCTEQSPCVCSGEAVLDFGSQPQSHGESSRDEATAGDAAKQVPLRLARASRSAEERQSKPKLWFTEPVAATTASKSKVLVCPTVDRHPNRLPPLLFPHANGARADPRSAAPWPMTAPLPGRAYAPYQARQKTIWPVYGSPSKSSDRSPSDAGAAQRPAVEPTVFRMRKQPDPALSYSMATPECSGDPSNCSACATDPALKDFCIAVAAHLQSDRSPGQDDSVPLTPVILDAGNALPLRRKRPPPHHADDASSLHRSEAHRLAPISLYTNGHGRAEAPHRHHQPVRGSDHTDTRPRLWALSRSYQGVAGQSNETVHALPHARSTLAQQPYPRPQPLHRRSYVDSGATRGCLRRHTESEVLTLGPQHQSVGLEEEDVGAAAAKRESVPHAWQRIKQHPSFAQWQGGLDMLADVVTRRSTDSIAEQEEDDEEVQRRGLDKARAIADSDGRTKIQPTPPSLAQSLWRGASSADRGEANVEKDSLKRPRQSDRSSPSADANESMPVDGPSPSAPLAALHSPSAASLAQSKRRRIYVERKRVDDVLAMLDSVAPSSPRQEGAQTSSCACPLSKAL